MKRSIPVKYLHSLVCVFLSFFFSSTISFSQESGCVEQCPKVFIGENQVIFGEENDFLSRVEEFVTFQADSFFVYATDFNRNDASYRTVAPKVWKGNENGYYHWNDFIWAKYEQISGNDYGWKIIEDPPPLGAGGAYPNVNKSRIYIEFCHKVKLNANEGLNYQNNLNLIICGELQVGELVIIIPVPEVIIYSLSCEESDDQLTCQLRGSVIVSEALVTEVGFWIAPAGIDINTNLDIYKIPIPSDIEIDPNALPFIFPSQTDEPYLFYHLLSGGDYQVYAYAVNETGVGISEVSLVPPSSGKTIDKKLKEAKDKNSDDGSTSTLNNIKLTLCCSSSVFKVGTLRVGNNANLEVNGNFYVNSIVGTSKGCNTNNFCVTGSGVIMTPTGGIPDFECINGWNDTNGDGYPDAYTPGSTTNSCGFSDGTLPIELLFFNSKIRVDRIDINWTTGTEINNDYFTIERSRDMFGWEVLGFVPGAGNSSVPLSYSFSDLRPLDGLAYYRLKQTDFDGKFEYFGPIAAHYDLGMEGLDFKVLKQYTNWVIAVPNDGVYQVEVYNLMGHRLVSERTENTLTIPAPEGAVVIRVTDGYARSASRVVM